VAGWLGAALLELADDDAEELWLPGPEAVIVTVWLDDEFDDDPHAASAAAATPSANSRAIFADRAKPPSESPSVGRVRFHIAAPIAPIRVTRPA
jgi:hypothetical protein